MATPHLEALLAQYLSETYGDAIVRRTWEEMRAQPPFAADTADWGIRDALTLEGVTLADMVVDYATAVYRMDYADTHVAAWRGILNSGETAADDLGGPRPARDRRDLLLGNTVTDTVDLGEGGMRVR